VNGKEGYRVQLRYGQYVNGTWFYLLQRQLLVVHNGKDCQIVLTRLQSDSIDGAAGLRSIEASLKFN
jgi:peptidyl-tRNA hydrolase